MKILLLLLFTITNTFAGEWEYRVSSNINGLKDQNWKAHPLKGNIIPREFEGYLEYRTLLANAELKPAMKIYLGKIGDADRVYLNGVQIGQTGNFPPNFSYDMDTERTYFIPGNLINNKQNELKILVYSKFLVNKGFSPSSFRMSSVTQMDSIKYSNELLGDFSKVIIPILCLVLAAVSFPFLAPKHQWNTQVMIFLIGLSSSILGICRGRILYHYFEMLPVYKLTLISSVVTIWLITLFMTKQCRNIAKYIPTALAIFLIGFIIQSQTLVKAAFIARVWFHMSPFFLIFALYGALKSSSRSYFKTIGLVVLIFTSFNDNLNDLRIISSVSLLQIGLGIFITSMILDQLLSLKASWEKYFMKEARLEIDAAVGRQALQIAHDLRSPLEAITSSLTKLKFDSDSDEFGLKLGLSRINQICNSLLKTNEPSSNYPLNEIQSAIHEVTNELRLIHKENKELTFQVNDSASRYDLNFSIDVSILKRTLSNLITNSIEACNQIGKISISAFFVDSSLVINIEDPGNGLPIDLDPIFERGFTTKPNGNGFGLSSAKAFIESIGGTISLKRLKEGTLVTLTIPSTQPKIIENDIVLIDDDPLVRFTWKRQAQIKGISVHAFENYASFIKVSANYKSDTPIYIDSNLGDVKGELAAEELVFKGFKKVILTTGAPANTILNKKWISGIVGKGFSTAILANN